MKTLKIFIAVALCVLSHISCDKFNREDKGIFLTIAVDITDTLTTKLDVRNIVLKAIGDNIYDPITLKLLVISDYQNNPSEVYQLAGTPLLDGNEYVRKEEIEKLIGQFDSAFQSMAQKIQSRPESNLFAQVVKEAQELCRKPGRSNVLIITGNLQDNTKRWSCLNPEYLKQVTTNPQHVQEVLLQGVSPHDLTGLTVYFPTYLPHSQQDDATYSAMRSLYQGYFESHHAVIEQLNFMAHE